MKDIAREVRFDARVIPHEAFAVHMGPPTVPKGSSTETSPLVVVERPAVQLDDDYLIVIFPMGYKAFRRAPDGRWTRQPGGWSRATERSLVKITVNVFHAMMWRRLRERWAELGALDEIPWEESSTTANVEPSQNYQVDEQIVANVDISFEAVEASTRQIVSSMLVQLTGEQRARLTEILERAVLGDLYRGPAQVLLMADEGQTTTHIAESLAISPSTVERICHRSTMERTFPMLFAPDSQESDLTDTPHSGVPVTLNGKLEVTNVDLACSDASGSRARRKAKLPVNRPVELKEDLLTFPDAKPLGRRLSRIKKS